MTINEK